MTGEYSACTTEEPEQDYLPSAEIAQPWAALMELSRRLQAIPSCPLDSIWEPMTKALDGLVPQFHIQALLIVIRDLDRRFFKARAMVLPVGVKSWVEGAIKDMEHLPRELEPGRYTLLDTSDGQLDELRDALKLDRLGERLVLQRMDIAEDFETLLVMALDDTDDALEVGGTVGMMLLCRLALAVHVSRTRRFAAYLSHAFKGSLQKIISMAEQFEDFCSQYNINQSLAGKRVRDMLKAISDMRERIVHIERVSVVSGARPVVRPVKIADHIKAGMARFEDEAKKRNIVFKLREPDSYVPGVMMAPRELDIVLANLLDNAVKYSFAERSIIIEVSTVGPQVVVGISNYGHGVLKDEREKIFHLFYRTRVPDPLRHVPGSGIGLYVVKRILEDYGGSIRVDSFRGIKGKPAVKRDSDEHKGLYYKTTLTFVLPGAEA